LLRAASQKLSGHGCPAIYEAGRAKFLPKRSEPRWGEQAVLREQGSADPLILDKYLFELVSNCDKIIKLLELSIKA